MGVENTLMKDDFASALNAARGIAINQHIIDDLAAPAEVNNSPKQDRIELKSKNQETHPANLPTSEETLCDIEMAKGLLTDTRTSIQKQAATAIHAQANLASQGVLNLLK